ncbi:MAG: seg [archaeon GW2011_AR5]|nr:MAG: seg [archaeon GW2011_AR5]
MVYLVKVDDEVFAIPGGFVDVALDRYAGRTINYAELKEALKRERIDGGDAPQMGGFGDLGYLDFDTMEERALREPLPIGRHRTLYHRTRERQ